MMIQAVSHKKIQKRKRNYLKNILNTQSREK